MTCNASHRGSSTGTMAGQSLMTAFDPTSDGYGPIGHTGSGHSEDWVVFVHSVTYQTSISLEQTFWPKELGERRKSPDGIEQGPACKIFNQEQKSGSKGSTPSTSSEKPC